MEKTSRLVRYELPIAVLACGIIIGMMMMFGMFVIGIMQFIDVWDSPVTIDINETLMIDYFTQIMNETYGVDYYD